MTTLGSSYKPTWQEHSDLTTQGPVLRTREAVSRLPIFNCPHAVAPPSVDDLLAEAAWQGAVEVGPFYCLRPSSAYPRQLPRFATRLRCQWDQEFFHVRFDCQSPDVWATKTERDCQLWDDPVVEAFLDPAGRGESFFEFQVNPLGTVYDSHVADVSLAGDWQRWCQWNASGLRVAVRVDGKLNDPSYRDNGWSAALAIPWEDLQYQSHPRPHAGDIWRANFCRYERARELAEPELSCWAPGVKVFDDLPRFGAIRFVE